jgi:hypothetical protein
MMKRKILWLLLATMTVGVACAQPQAASLGSLYHTLDSLIERHDDFVAAKEARIKSLVSGWRGIQLTPEQEYDMNLRLYDEYLAFRFDSAYAYIHRNMLSPLAQSDADRHAVTAIRMAHILAVSGIFNNARQLLESISLAQVSNDARVAYYNQQAELNLYRSEMAQYTPYFMEYIDSAQYYRQLLLQVAPKESFEYVTNRAAYACERGDVAGAIHQLKHYLPTLQPGDRRYSVVTSTMAYFYWKAGQPSVQERYLLLAAISDLRGAILENNALRELAAILMERGEYEKAYRYLTRASNDAREYGSRLRSMQVARMAPHITKAYDIERERARQRTRRLLIAMTVIALLLMCTIGYTLSLIRKRRKDNEKISQMNVEQSHNIEELQILNSQFSILNSRMKEANRIKDEYIGRFLELSSNLIHRDEERTKLLNRLARDRKLEDLYAELKSPKAINEGIRIFHQNFDTAFLNIYPDFIEEVNRLMTADNQFDISSERLRVGEPRSGMAPRLTTELRVLALIRLGITDNQKIADILRSSLTTIYTYRSKLKSRARIRETFEDDIQHIATY